MALNLGRQYYGSTKQTEIEHGTEITLEQPPQPWSDGDMVDVKLPNGQVEVLHVSDHDGSLVFEWEDRTRKDQVGGNYHLDLDKVDDKTFRVSFRHR